MIEFIKRFCKAVYGALHSPQALFIVPASCFMMGIIGLGLLSFYPNSILLVTLLTTVVSLFTLAIFYYILKMLISIADAIPQDVNINNLHMINPSCFYLENNLGKPLFVGIYAEAVDITLNQVFYCDVENNESTYRLLNFYFKNKKFTQQEISNFLNQSIWYKNDDNNLTSLGKLTTLLEWQYKRRYRCGA
jgi:hypothetical protein